MGGRAQQENGIRVSMTLTVALLQAVAVPSHGRGPYSWPRTLGPSAGVTVSVGKSAGKPGPVWGWGAPFQP